MMSIILKMTNNEGKLKNIKTSIRYSEIRSVLILQSYEIQLLLHLVMFGDGQWVCLTHLEILIKIIPIELVQTAGMLQFTGF